MVNDGIGLIYTVLILSAALYVLDRIPARSHSSHRIILLCKSILFTLLCLTELYYFIGVKGGIWFCDYKLVGVWKAILGFIIFTLILCIQYISFRVILRDLNKNSTPVDYHIGLFSFVLAILAIIVCNLILKLEDFYAYIALFLFIAQCIQIVLIFYQCKPYWKYAIASTFIYLVGTFALVVALYHYALPFITALILYGALRFITFMLSNNKDKKNEDHL